MSKMVQETVLVRRQEVRLTTVHRLHLLPTWKTFAKGNTTPIDSRFTLLLYPSPHPVETLRTTYNTALLSPGPMKSDSASKLVHNTWNHNFLL